MLESHISFLAKARPPIISAIAGRPLFGRLLSTILQAQYIVYKL